MSSSRKRSPSDPASPSHKKARGHQKCDWILDEPAYRNWKQRNTDTAPCLWIHGPPGIGKSVLAHFIIDDLAATDGTAAVLRYFCDISSTPASVLQSFLTQLDVQLDVQAQQSSSGAPVDAQYRLWDVLATSFLPSVNYSIVVDGLDELFPTSPEPQLQEFTRRLVELTAVPDRNVQLLVSSRTDADIRAALSDATQLQITPEHVSHDIRSFLLAEISLYPQLEALEGVLDEILRRANGNFLWASYAIQALSQEQDPETALRSLAQIPPSLESLYVRVLARQTNLTPEHEMLRSSIFRWMLTAVRPMRTVEVANAIAVETLAFVPDLDKTAIEACSHLIKVEDGLLKPSHYSVRDFLVSDAAAKVRGLSPPDANLRIAKTLLAYLNSPQFLELDPKVSDSFQETYPLVEYATLYWTYHVSQSAADNDLRESIRTFFSGKQAVLWFDRFLPAYLSSSVIPVPPRPTVNCRFFHLSMLKSQIVRYFDEAERNEVERLVTESLRNAYEGFAETARTTRESDASYTLQRLVELGELYTWLPDYEKQAPALFQEAVDLSSDGAEHREWRIAAQQALADDLKRNGKYQEAQALLEQTLELAMRDSAPTQDHVFLLDTLGWVSMRLGQLDVAAGYLRRALSTAAEILGAHSPLTLRARITLAEVLGKLGHHAEAEELCEALKAQLEQHRTEGAPLPKDAVGQLNILAAIYVQEEKYEKAREAYEVVVAERRAGFGADHRLTLWAEMQLGFAMRKAGNREAALVLLEGLLPRQRRVLGEHQDVKDVEEAIAELREQ